MSWISKITPREVTQFIQQVQHDGKNLTTRYSIQYSSISEKNYTPVGGSGDYLEVISVPKPFWLRFNSPDIVGLNERYIDRPCIFRFPFSNIYLKRIDVSAANLIIAVGLTAHREEKPQGYILPYLIELSCEENTSTYTPFFYTKPYERKTLYLFGNDSNLQYAWQVKKYKSDGISFYYFDITALKSVPYHASAPVTPPQPIMMDTLTDQIEEFRVRIKNNDTEDPHKIWYWFECE